MWRHITVNLGVPVSSIAEAAFAGALSSSAQGLDEIFAGAAQYGWLIDA